MDPNDALLESLPTLSDTHINILSAPFTKEEIKAAAFSPKPCKSPGPDGFPPMFFQEKWDTFGTNVCDIMQMFTSTNHLLRESNKTYICLIPKTKNPTTPSQFRVQTNQPLQLLIQNHFKNVGQPFENDHSRLSW